MILKPQKTTFENLLNFRFKNFVFIKIMVVIVSVPLADKFNVNPADEFVEYIMNVQMIDFKLFSCYAVDVFFNSQFFISQPSD